MVSGETFFHYIPINVLLTARAAPVGTVFSYRGADGLEWIVTVGIKEFEFLNVWKTGRRSFKVERRLL
jgi:hypothetical protein